MGDGIDLEGLDSSTLDLGDDLAATASRGVPVADVDETAPTATRTPSRTSRCGAG